MKTYLKSRMYLIMFLILSILIGVSKCKEEDPNIQTPDVKDQVDDILSTFMLENHFQGSQIGIVIGSKLVYAEGKGRINEIDAQPDTVVPILDLSKAITAVAILQLVESRQIKLNDTVFGADCLLQDFLDTQPWVTPDLRLYNITIEHLLTHSAGWDETSSEILDPMMNPLLLSLGYNVPDIKAQMNYYDQYTIIQYMVNTPLNFQPGSKVVHSNLGYSILGRVIEAVVGESYESYVKKNILEVSGMWHTHIGPVSSHLHDIFKQKHMDEKLEEDNNNVNLLETSVDPQILDSTLGWHSNVYDVARFFVTLFESKEEILLKQSTVKFAMSQYPSLAKHHHFGWSHLGMNEKKDGAVMQESRERQHGINVFFYREPGFNFFTETSDYSWNEHENIRSFIFIGFTSRHKKHIRDLNNNILDLDLNKLDENVFLRDLIQYKVKTGEEITLLNTMVEDKHILAFANAIKLAGYHPIWIHGYTDQQNTYYLTICNKAKKADDLKYTLAKFHSKAHLWTFLAQNDHQYYQMSFVQSFIGASQDHEQQHLLIMTRPKKRKVVMFDLYQRLSVYDTTLRHSKAEGFQPVVVSIIKNGLHNRVSYILEKPHVPTKHFRKIKLDHLENQTVESANDGYYMSYIDGYTDKRGRPVFSVVYTEESVAPIWKLQMNLKQDSLITERASWSSQNYSPKFIITYTKDQSLHFLVYLKQKCN